VSETTETTAGETTAGETTAGDTLVAERATREVDVIGADGAKSGTVELPGDVFDVQVNVPLIHQVVVAQLAAARQGTASTKNRGEVRGGGRKPYRQKGTGRARQGSTRAPQFAGGGVVHGPTPRSYAQRTPKKMKAAALRGALSDRARNGRVHVVSALIDGDAPSTKAAVAALTGLSERKHVLVVAQRSDVLTWKSLRNAGRVHLISPGQLNTYDVLVSDDVVFTRAALEDFLAGPARGRGTAAVATETEAAEATAIDSTATDSTETDSTETDSTETDSTEGSDK
jgi:large subunit ribosomal protein L4